MSKIQWFAIGALSTILVCIFGCVVIALMLQSSPNELSTQNSDSFAPTIASNVATPFASPQSASASNPNIQFQIRQYSTYESRWGSRILIGDTINTSNVAVCCINVVVSLLDAQGNVVETSSYNGADLCEVEPNQRYPFLTPIGDTALKYSEIKIQFQARAASASIFPCYKKLKVDSLNAHPPKYDFDAIGFTGKVTNVGDEVASSVKILILAYDENDNFYDVADGYAELSEIPPGGDSPFEANFRRLRKPAARYEIFAQAR